MGLAEDHRRQTAWRSWSAILDALPELAGARVLDLGCGVGDVASHLAARGARVVGVEGNPELLEHARARDLAGVELFAGDLREELELGATEDDHDGIWCSFVAAYFPDLGTALARWKRHLRPGGWIALVEVDDLFAHEPVTPRTRAQLEAYADDALASRRYDFRMGRRLADRAIAAGLAVERVFDVPDRELAFDGPASADVLEAWRARLDRMVLLRARCGAEFERVRDDLCGCLGRPDHRADARVVCCLARSSAEDALPDPLATSTMSNRSLV
jgi:SAM-dependent methyltransferase